LKIPSVYLGRNGLSELNRLILGITVNGIAMRSRLLYPTGIMVLVFLLLPMFMFSETEGIEQLRQEAEAGDAEAQYNLGFMYSDIDPLKDKVKAYMWLSIAATNGDKSSKNKAWLMEIFMSPEEIAEAKKLAEEWLEKHQEEM